MMRIRILGFILAATILSGSVRAAEVKADILAGVKSGLIGVDKAADGGRCVVANLTQAGGQAFAGVTPLLQPGVYDAVLHLKVSQTNHINSAPLNWTFAVDGAAEAKESFDILVIEQAGVYQSILLRFTVARPGTVTATLDWARKSIRSDGVGVNMRIEKKDIPKGPDTGGLTDKKEDAEDKDMDLDAQLANEPEVSGLKYLHMAVDKVTIVPVADAEVSALGVNKIRYKPGEKAKVSVKVRNLKPAARELKVETVLVSDLDTVIAVDSRVLKLAAGAEEAFLCEGPAFADKWGYAVRCRAFEGERQLHERSEYFTVHNNMWAVVIAGRGPAQFTAHVTRENAIASAQANKKRYRNWVESGFWAPDEFGDFTPDTEYWWGGQGCYYGSVTGTRTMTEEGHKVGIAYAVYSNIWGGDGPPAFEMVRAKPDWGYASSFDVEWFDRWDRNTMGTGKGGRGMHVWPVTIINYKQTDAFKHHGRELITANKTLGWDAVRYDSHAISSENARVMDIVKSYVRAELPEFQFGYNSSVPLGVADKIEAFKAQCEGEGLIMEEGIRQFGGGGMSFGKGRTYADFAKRILDFKEEARKYGGHFLAIGMDKCYPSDMIYQYIFWFAGNTHPCYDWQETSVANYMQFATRFAGQLWDLKVTSVAKPLDWVELGEAAKFLWMPERYIHQRDLGNGRRQLIIHLINAPAETVLFTHDDAKLPPPRENLKLSVKLPDKAQLRSAWLLTAEPTLQQVKLAPENSGGKVALTVPRLRFWDVIVLDLDSAAAF